MPVAVFRRYGAGRVLYLGLEETWRWRYEVGDRFHQKFWNQASRWIMEAAYPVQDRHVALDTGPLTHKPGTPIPIRARLRDATGRLLLNASARAAVYQDGRRFLSVDLTADEQSGGVFRGRTPPLPEGRYEVRVEVEGLPATETPAHTTFVVEASGGGEMARLQLNEPLGRQLAHLSGGRYFREENLSELRRQLEPLSQGRIIESETVLWQSWWWFVPLVLALTLEWLWRKRVGLL